MAQFGTISFIPLTGYCNTNTLGFDTTHNVVYSCGTPPQNFWKVVTFETVQSGPLSGTCNPNSLGFDTTNNVVYSCGSAPNNTWTIVGGGGGGGGGGGPVTSPFIVNSPSLISNVTITVPDSGNASITSSTGTIQFSNLFVADLAGSGTSCLQADPSGNITRSGLPCASGSGGITYNVPSQYSTVQSAITASSGGTGPVSVSPNATDKTPFTNTTNVRVDDYRQQGGIDSRFFRDASEWGVKHDAIVAGKCVTTAGSNVINCPLGQPGYNFTGFTSADVGKLFIAYGSGPPSGNVDYDIAPTIVNGGSGATPNAYFQAINTDASSGCNTLDTQPYMWLHTNASGVVFERGWYYSFPGQGCTHFPTTWTLQPGAGQVAGSGTITLSGGAINPKDQPTVITAVNSPTQITVADTMTAAQTTSMIYGTDDKNAWTAACNAMKDAPGAASKNYSYGVLTFHGTSMVSGGVQCNGPSIWILGTGYSSLGDSSASMLVYAGKTTGDFLLRMDAGQGARISKVGLRGNSMAQPYLLYLAFNASSTGPGINTTGHFEDLSLGWMYADQAGQPRGSSTTNMGWYSSQSCIYADAANKGNDDFNEFDRIYCRGALVGVDGNNSQATGWSYGTFHNENNVIGIAVGGGTYYKLFYTEANKLDIMLGSPTTGGWYPTYTVFESYGGESSAQQIDVSTLSTAYRTGVVIIRDAWGLGAPNYIGPKNISMDLRNFNGGSPGIFEFHGAIPGKVYIARSCLNQQNLTFDTSARYSQTVQYFNIGAYSSQCDNLIQSNIHWYWDGFGNGSNAVQTQINSYPSYTPASTAITDIMGAQQIVGSLKLASVAAQGDDGHSDGANQYLEAFAAGTTGTTTYHYQVTCKDGLGNESYQNPVVLAVTNGNATLSSTNYNAIGGYPHKGCATYCLYGDEGSGGMGQLACVEQTAMSPSISGSQYTGAYFADAGQYTKNTAITPPVVSQSGAVDSSGYRILGRPFAGFKVPLVVNYYTQGRVLTGSQFLADFSTKQAANGLMPIWNGTQYVPNSPVPTPAGVVGSAGGITSQAGNTTIGANPLVGGGTYIYLVAFTPTAAPPATAVQITDVKQYIGSVGGGLIYAAIYDSDGIDNLSQPNAPGTLLCGDIPGVAPTLNGWNTLSGLDVTTCPYLSLGHKYFVATTASATPQLRNDTVAFDGTTYYTPTVVGLPCCFFPLKIATGGAVEQNMHTSQYVDLSTVYAFSSYTPSNPIPANILGTGSTGGGTNCLKDNQTWGTCGGGSGPLYSTPFPGISMSTSTGLLPLTGTGCSSNICTMTTPSSDSTYRFTVEMVQTTAGVGTCTTGSMQLQLGYINPDNGLSTLYNMAGHFMNAVSGLQNIGLTNNVANGVGSMFVSWPIEFRAQGGTAITFRVNIVAAYPAACTTLPVVTVRPALYGPLGY